MHETLAEYYQERYLPLETELLAQTENYWEENFARLKADILVAWERSLTEALAVQAQESLPCGYISFSLLNTSLLAHKPLLQLDFYNEDWVYGDPWARYRMAGDILFTRWENFRLRTMDEKYYIRSHLPPAIIKSLYWDTADKLIYRFVGWLKGLVRELATSPLFVKLKKESALYVTCGTYLDWQERIYGVLSEVDLTNPPENESLAYREFSGVNYDGHIFSDLELKGVRFLGCSFRNCRFDNVDLRESYFRECDFYRTTFASVKMGAARWENSNFVEASFSAVTTQGEEDEYLPPLEIRRCKFTQTKAADFDRSRLVLRDNLETEGNFLRGEG